MKRLQRVLLTATAFTLSLAAAANAAEAPKAGDVLAGGPIFSGSQSYFYCEFINLGTSNITPTAQQVFVDFSTTAVSTGTSCANGTAVPPNQTCFIYPSSSLPTDSLSCKVSFSGPVTNVRGAFELYDSNYDTLATVELR
ncbi:MAG TPA: hypothetical protein VKR31_00380 [Rhizomicrobium sp.]|nr:hypothetical protein [Rhizomicrobium sp.]